MSPSQRKISMLLYALSSQVILQLMLNKPVFKGSNHMVKLSLFSLIAFTFKLNENPTWELQPKVPTLKLFKRT